MSRLPSFIWLIPAMIAGAGADQWLAPLNPAARADATQPWRGSLVGRYRAEVLRVLDGDTLEARVRVWLGEDIVTRVRLAGIDAPEIRGRCDEERRRALEARAALEHLVEGRAVILADIGPDKYFGRVVGRILIDGERDAGAILLAAGHARAYDGRTRTSWCAAE